MYKTHRKPPAPDLKAARAILSDQMPGPIHLLMGAGAAGYALLVLMLAGLLPDPVPVSVCAVALIGGTLGGALIRMDARRRLNVEIIARAWAVYHARRKREYGQLWN